MKKYEKDLSGKILQNVGIAHGALCLLLQTIFQAFAMENMFAGSDASVLHGAQTYGTNVIVLLQFVFGCHLKVA